MDGMVLILNFIHTFIIVTETRLFIFYFHTTHFVTNIKNFCNLKNVNYIDSIQVIQFRLFSYRTQSKKKNISYSTSYCILASSRQQLLIG